MRCILILKWTSLNVLCSLKCTATHPHFLISLLCIELHPNYWASNPKNALGHYPTASGMH